MAHGSTIQRSSEKYRVINSRLPSKELLSSERIRKLISNIRLVNQHCAYNECGSVTDIASTVEGLNMDDDMEESTTDGLIKDHTIL